MPYTDSMTFRRLAPLALLLVASACSHLSVRSPSHYFTEGTAPGGVLLLGEDLPLAELQGTPEEIGRAAGTIFKDAIRAVREETIAEYRHEFETIRERARGLEARIPERFHRELVAAASASGAPLADLELANLVVDACCTAFVASGSATPSGRLVFARNMDFTPAHVLGPSTVVTLYRSPGKKALVSIGWPGVNGVISGMNEDGLCAAILIQFGASSDRAGVPLCYRVRQLLEECSSVAEARAFYAKNVAASGHYVMVADRSTGAVLGSGVARSPREDGFLTCSNEAPCAFAPEVQSEDRARALDDLIHAHRGELDPDMARRILGATYVEHMNAQAMVFEPATLTLWLSRGTTLRPAATQGAVRVELAPAFARGVAQARVESCSSASGFEHYKGASYTGATISPTLVRAANELAGSLEQGAGDRVPACRQALFAAQELQPGGAEGAARRRLVKIALDYLEKRAKAPAEIREEDRRLADSLLGLNHAAHLELSSEEVALVESVKRAPHVAR